jgi:hypothetical protein
LVRNAWSIVVHGLLLPRPNRAEPVRNDPRRK